MAFEAISQFRDTLRRGREVLKTMRKNRRQSGERHSRIGFQLDNGRSRLAINFTPATAISNQSALTDRFRPI